MNPFQKHTHFSLEGKPAPASPGGGFYGAGKPPLKNCLKTAFFIVLLSILAFQGKAQWLNFGDGHDDPTCNYVISGTMYTDDIRDEVADVHNTVSGSGPYTNRVTIICNGTNPGFSRNDRIMLVDMSVGSGSRNYDLLTIGKIANGTGTYSIVGNAAVTNAPAIHVPLGSGKTYTQVIKIPQWCNVSFMTGAVLSCHPWNGHTGGILAFVCNGTLDLTATGCMISSENCGTQGAMPNPGGPAGNISPYPGTAGLGGTTELMDGTSASGSPLGHVSDGNGGISMETKCAKNTSGGNGGCGDHAIDGLGPIPGNLVSPLFPPADKPTLYIAFANGGNSGGSGQGGGAGGHGGGGGAGGYFIGDGFPANDPSDGGSGTNPINGTGGIGGPGGYGGGFVYINASTINGPGGSTIVISSKGQPGTPGEDKTPSLGGYGGIGGRGGDGKCSTTGAYDAPGGGGGYGEGGNGADGGNGGNGGDGGGVWIGYGSLSGFSVANNVDAHGGPGGAGGPGGPEGVNGTQGNDGATPSVCSGSVSCGSCDPVKYIASFYFGSPNVCIYPVKCSCNEAFRVLTTMSQHTMTGTWPSVIIKYTNPVSGDSRNYCTWDPGNGLLAYEWAVYTAGTCSTPGQGVLRIWKCGMTCTLDAWKNIAPPTGSWNSATYTATWTGTGGPIAEYKKGAFTDKINKVTCYSSGCSDGWIGEHISPFPFNPYPPSVPCDTCTPPPPCDTCPPPCDTCTVLDPPPCTCPPPPLDPGDCPRPCHGHPGAGGNPGGDGGTDESNIPPTDTSGDPAAPFQPNSGIKNEIAGNLKGLNVVPNPTKDYLNLKFTSDRNMDCNITITDMAGKTLYTGPMKAIKGDNIQTIDVKSFAAGTYIINLQYNNTVQKATFIVSGY